MKFNTNLKKISEIDSLLNNDKLFENYIDDVENELLSSPKGLKENILTKINEYDMLEALNEANKVTSKKTFKRKFIKILKVCYLAIFSIIISEGLFSQIYNDETTKMINEARKESSMQFSNARKIIIGEMLPSLIIVDSDDETFKTNKKDIDIDNNNNKDTQNANTTYSYNHKHRE